MKKIAIINGSFVKDATQPVKNCYIDGELQQRVAQFGHKYKIIDIQPIDGRTILIQYEE